MAWDGWDGWDGLEGWLVHGAWCISGMGTQTLVGFHEVRRCSHFDARRSTCQPTGE